MNEGEYTGSAEEANQSELCSRLSGCRSCIVSLTQEPGLPQSPLFRMKWCSKPGLVLHPSSEASSSLTMRGLEELPNGKKCSSRRRRISLFLSQALAFSLLLTLLGGLPLAGAQSSAPSTTPPVSAPPTIMPITRPPTNLPTVSPVATDLPTVGPVASKQPSVGPTVTSSPTAAPTRTPTPMPTPVPTLRPTVLPTSTPTPIPTPVPTLQPTVAPSNTPTPVPTSVPTLQPTVSHSPSDSPSENPSDSPSGAPSDQPTIEPTFDTIIVATSLFRQQFTLGGNQVFFTVEEIILLQDLYENYTDSFSPRNAEDGRINTICNVELQRGLDRRRLGGGANQEGRQLQVNEVDFTMTYRSRHTDVTGYPERFKNYVNANLDNVTLDLQNLGLNVTATASAGRITVQVQPSPAPTISLQPTPAPSLRPTAKLPSSSPSDLTTSIPTEKDVDESSAMPTAASTLSSALPSTNIPGTPQPTESPSDAPTQAPTIQTEAPTQDENDSGLLDNTYIVVGIAAAGSVLLIGLFCYYRRRKLRREQAFQTNAANSRKAEHAGNGEAPDEGNWNEAVRKPAGFEGPASAAPRTPFDKNGGYTSKVAAPAGPGGMGSPSESLVSNQSLLSAGNSMAGDSGDEADATQNLADEFDQYKDQNLEKMRADVEGNLTGFDGMMSQALTKALIDDDELQVDPKLLLWGGLGKRSGPEIEASALGEVTDWLKRKEDVSVEEKRGFMQETLNRMVASVRHGVLGPDDASRTIHECAALLGLQLATEIPVTTLIITGMRKTVAAEDMMEAFREFGDISEAAVASNQRGFGILRFKTNKSVDRAMQKFRAEEIVVQDVAVQVKVLKPGGSNHSRSGKSTKPSPGKIKK